MKRTLRLKSERLSELDTDDMRSVVGGVETPTLPVAICLSIGFCGTAKCPTRASTCLC